MRAFCSTTRTVRPSSWFEVADDPVELLDGGRGEAERRLVEHQQARPRDERAGEREHLLLAAGERPGLLAAAVLDPREVLERAPRRRA